MKVISVTNRFQNNASYSKHSDNQQKNQYGLSFNGYWSVDVLKKTDNEVMDMAKYFYKSTSKELEDATTVRTPLLGIKRKYASLAAFYKLKCATDKINSEVQEIKTKLAELNRLNHINADEAMAIRALKNKLDTYETCFDKRHEKFYCQEEYNPDEPFDKYLNPFYMSWEDELAEKK